MLEKKKQKDIVAKMTEERRKAVVKENVAEKKNVEYFEMLMKQLQELVDIWITNQKEFMESWLEASRKLQESFSSAGGGQFGKPEKDMLGMYNTWLNSIVNSSKVFTDQAMKMQEAWSAAAEEQMAMGSRIVKSSPTFSSRATG